MSADPWNEKGYRLQAGGYRPNRQDYRGEPPHEGSSVQPPQRVSKQPSSVRPPPERDPLEVIEALHRENFELAAKVARFQGALLAIRNMKVSDGIGSATVSAMRATAEEALFRKPARY